MTLKAHVTGRLRPALIVLACAVGLVMLIEQTREFATLLQALWGC